MRNPKKIVQPHDKKANAGGTCKKCTPYHQVSDLEAHYRHLKHHGRKDGAVRR